MVKFNELPFPDRFTERFISAHPSLEHRDLGEVALTWLTRQTPKRYISRHNANRSQTVLDNALNLQLRELGDDPSTKIIQIGAHDGKSDDPLYESLNTNDWSAVLVEPTNIAFKALEKLRGSRPHTKLVNKAVTPDGEPITLFVPAINNLEVFGAVWTSTDRSQVEREIKRNLGSLLFRSVEIDPVEIDGISPRDLMRIGQVEPTELSVLICDIEGQDPPVIQAFLDEGIHPKLLMYEHLHADRTAATEVNLRLLDQGYRLLHSEKDTLATYSS